MKIRKNVEETAIEVCKRNSHSEVNELHVLRALISVVGADGSSMSARDVDKALYKIPIDRSNQLTFSQGAVNILDELETEDPKTVRDSVINWYLDSLTPKSDNADNSDVPPQPDVPQNKHDNTPPKKPTNTSKKEKVSGKKENLETVLAELNSLIGLNKAKAQVTQLIQVHNTNQQRIKQGQPAIPVGLHLVFTGNPGTGKTTVARLIGRLYNAIGLLEKGQLIEVDRSKLVAGYVGQTAIQTQAAIDSADGGVLFIDEAYSLAADSGTPYGFGDEAIATLVKEMEDRRDSMAVIVAGYKEDMDSFVKSNQGLKSRFQTYIDFEDYSSEELVQIFELSCRTYQVRIDSDVRQELIAYIDRVKPSGEDGNGRFARNLFEKMYVRLSSRVANLSSPSPDEMNSFVLADIPDYEANISEENTDKPKFKFGFN